MLSVFHDTGLKKKKKKKNKQIHFCKGKKEYLKRKCLSKLYLHSLPNACKEHFKYIMPFPSVLKASAKKQADGLMRVSLYATTCFSPAALEVLLLYLYLLLF